MYMYIVKLIFAKENIAIYQMYQNPQPCPVKILKIKIKNNCITVQYGLNNNSNKIQSLLGSGESNIYIYLSLLLSFVAAFHMIS